MGRLAFAIAAVLALSCGGSGAGPLASAATVAPTLAVPSPSAAPAASPSPRSLWSPAQAPVYPCGPGVASGSCAPKGIEWVAIESSLARPIVAAVLRPAAAVPAPIVVFLHGDGGLRPSEVDFAASLAKDGALVVVPCWQGRIGGRPSPQNIGCTQSAPLRSSAADVVKDVSAVADAARTLPGARPDRVVVVGHSAGAAASLLAASMGGHVQAVVAIDSPYPSESEGTAGLGLRARWGAAPTEHAADLAVPVMIVHGTDDQQAPPTSVDRARAFEREARERGKKIDTIYVDGGGHEFVFSELFTADLRARLIAFVIG